MPESSVPQLALDDCRGVCRGRIAVAPHSRTHACVAGQGARHPKRLDFLSLQNTYQSVHPSWSRRQWGVQPPTMAAPTARPRGIAVKHPPKKDRLPFKILYLDTRRQCTPIVSRTSGGKAKPGNICAIIWPTLRCAPVRSQPLFRQSIDDRPNKPRRNVVALSAAILAIACFHFSIRPTSKPEASPRPATSVPSRSGLHRT